MGWFIHQRIPRLHALQRYPLTVFHLRNDACKLARARLSIANFSSGVL